MLDVAAQVMPLWGSLSLSLSLVRIYCTWLWNHITRRLILQARRRYGLSFADFVRRDGKSS